MSKKSSINLQLYNDHYRLNYNSLEKVNYIKEKISLFDDLKEHCKDLSSIGFTFFVNFESRMKHLELILKITEEISNSMEFLSDVEVNSMLLVINEALSNAVYHGNLNIPQNFRSKNTLLQFENKLKKDNPDILNKKVDLKVNVNKNDFEITVCDNGNGFDYNKVLNVDNPPSPEEETGRGIFILKNSVDFIKFSNKGKTLIMKKEWRTI